MLLHSTISVTITTAPRDGTRPRTNSKSRLQETRNRYLRGAPVLSLSSYSVPDTVPKTIHETVPETVHETVPEIVPETVHETVLEIVPETAPETVLCQTIGLSMLCTVCGLLQPFA